MLTVRSLKGQAEQVYRVFKEVVLPLIRQELYCAPRGDWLTALMSLTAISICFLVVSNNDDMFHSI